METQRQPITLFGLRFWIWITISVPVISGEVKPVANPSEAEQRLWLELFWESPGAWLLTLIVAVTAVACFLMSKDTASGARLSVPQHKIGLAFRRKPRSSSLPQPRSSAYLSRPREG